MFSRAMYVDSIILRAVAKSSCTGKSTGYRKNILSGSQLCMLIIRSGRLTR